MDLTGIDKEKAKQIATTFYRWWHNQPGTNTDDGFDQWYEENRPKRLKAYIPERVDSPFRGGEWPVVKYNAMPNTITIDVDFGTHHNFRKEDVVLFEE